MSSLHNDLVTWAAKAHLRGKHTIELKVRTAQAIAVQMVEMGQRIAELEHQLRTVSPDEVAAKECHRLQPREFTNELGNRIKITIEGPTSISENVLTPQEATELHDGLSAHLTTLAREAVELCKHDGKPCYVSAGTDDAHWRCGTSACKPGEAEIEAALAEREIEQTINRLTATGAKNREMAADFDDWGSVLTQDERARMIDEADATDRFIAAYRALTARIAALEGERDQARAAEREACAKIAATAEFTGENRKLAEGWHNARSYIAEQIRNQDKPT